MDLGSQKTDIIDVKDKSDESMIVASFETRRKGGLITPCFA